MPTPEAPALSPSHPSGPLNTTRTDPATTPSTGAVAHRGRGPVRVVGDFGGTHARLAVLGGRQGELERIRILASGDYPRIRDAVGDYLDMEGIREPGEICLAVAGPVEGDTVHLPNTGWRFSRTALQEALGAPLTVINDFTAQALSLELLGEADLEWYGEPRPGKPGVRAVIGPGTGLGVALALPGGRVLSSEAGHAGFAPADEHEAEILRLLLPRYGRVSVERVVSGPGLENLYRANRALAEGGRGAGPGVPEGRPGDATDIPSVPAREVSRLAQEGDPVALRAVRDFLGILASFAGDMALTAWATGGVYLSGGMLGKMEPLFDADYFRARFQDKGRFSAFCSGVPVARITAQHPGLLGCAAALATGFRPGWS